MAFLMAGVKKDTDAWRLHKSIKEYDPTKREEEISKQKKAEEEQEASSNAGPSPFKTALELSKEKGNIVQDMLFNKEFIFACLI